jgi:MoaA/NifB/PqqE/SkfB family radical SAM enzyme
MMSLEDCLESAKECGAPMVSVCGGEPLIYPHIEELVHGLLKQKRIVYLCTNGTKMRDKLRDYLASVYDATVEPVLEKLLAERLISVDEAEEVRNGKSKAKKKVIKPTPWLYWNVHIDGLEYTHDLIVEREGVFREAVAAIRMAKILGFQVATNTTVYRETDVREIEEMFEFFSSLEVDGHTISPGYDYDAAKKAMTTRGEKCPEDFFLTRKLTREKFARIEEWGERFTIFGTPVFQEFLAGKRELSCTAWAIPTRNIKGWKAPCYLITDGHYKTYKEMLRKADWKKYGVFDGVARDPRCENCMVHCGYDPSGALGTDAQFGDTWKNIKYNFGPRPKRSTHGHKVQAYNGVSAGKGHLSEGKKSINGHSKEKPMVFTARKSDRVTPGNNGNGKHEAELKLGKVGHRNIAKP